MARKARKVYELIFRGKGMLSQATSINEMVDAARAMTAMLEELKIAADAGKVTADFDATEDDYIVFYTEHKDIAKKFGFDVEGGEDVH